MATNTVKEKYKELLGYISQMGHKVKIQGESQIEMTLHLFNYFGNEILVVHLFQPLTDNSAYNYHRLRISWRMPPEGCLGNSKWYIESTDQSVIFKRLLFDIISWKIQNINKKSIDSSNEVIYKALKKWSIADKKDLHNFCFKTKVKALFKWLRL